MPTIFNSANDQKTTVSKKVSEDQHSQVMKDEKSSNPHSLPGHTHNPLSAFCYFPDHVSFVNKDPEEKVVLLLRRHPITNVRWMILAFLMIITPSFITFFSFIGSLPPEFQLVTSLVWYLLTTAFIIEEFLSWFFQVNIITDERVIDVDFVTLMYREMSDANIDNIQDVTVEVAGAIRTFFNYGDVVIQTAGERQRLTFEAVPHPDRVARVLRELRIEEDVERLEGRIR